MPIAAQGYSGIWNGPSDADAADMHLLYLAGLQLHRTTVATVTIAPGECRDDTDTEDIVVPGTLTFTVSSTGANGRNVDTAEQANKWYLVHVIKNPTTGAVAAFGINEDDIGGFTFPAGYTVKRYLGAIRNDGSSDFYDGEWFGNDNYRWWEYNESLWTVDVLNSGSSTSWQNVDCSEFIPPNSTLGHLHLEMEGGGLNDFGYVRWDGSTISTPIPHVYADSDWVQSVFLIRTALTQIIEYKVDDIACDMYIFVNGYAEWI